MAIVLPRQCNVSQLNATQMPLNEDQLHKTLERVSILCTSEPAPDLPLHGGRFLSYRRTLRHCVRDISEYLDSLGQ